MVSTGLDHRNTELQQDLPGKRTNPDGHKRIATEIVELLPSWRTSGGFRMRRKW